MKFLFGYLIVWLILYFYRGHRHRPKPSIIFFNQDGMEISVMSLRLGQKAPITAQPALNGIATNDAFDGPLSWSISDTTLASLTPAADGLSAELQSLVSSGTVIVNASGAVQGQALSGSLPVDLAAALPNGIVLTLGAPVTA